MKLASYEYRGARSFGVVLEDGLCDIPSCGADAPADVLAVLEAGERALGQIANLASACPQRIALDAVRLLPPVPAPPKILGLAVNYAAHHVESAGTAPPEDASRTTTPRPFLMPHTVLAGPGDEIAWPAYSETIDYEVELAIVIGRTCKGVTADEARDCIAGYTIANDVSARTCSHAAGRAKRDKDRFFDWLHGKWADGFCPTGPWLVTADEIGDPTQLDVQLRVNGETRQHANTSQMIFNVFQIVAFASQVMTLVPGDLIATGTPSGVGMATGNWLAAGDRITCAIEKIGELTNTLGPRPDSFYTPCQG